MNEFDIERFRLQRQNQSLGGLSNLGVSPRAERYRGGAIVWFKAGGPKMVILGSDGMVIYRCGWFVGAVFNQQNFHEDALVSEDPTMTSKPVKGIRILSRCVSQNTFEEI